MKIKKLFILFTLVVMFISYSYFDKNNAKIINLSELEIIIPLKNNDILKFTDNEFQLMLKLLFQDLDIYPSEIKDEYIKILNNNKEFINNEYNKFMIYFINFLKNNKKYKYSENEFNNKNYIRKRLYMIISNIFTVNLPVIYLQIIDKPKDEKELDLYNKLFYENKFFNDIIYFLLEILQKFKQKKDIQEFFNEFSILIKKQYFNFNLEEKLKYFIYFLNIQNRKNFNIYFCFSNIISTYKNVNPAINNILGLNDFSNDIIFTTFFAKAEFIQSLFKTSAIDIYPLITMTYSYFEFHDFFILTFYHELTHLYQFGNFKSGFYPTKNFPENLCNISELLKYFSIFNKEVATHEIDAEFTSLYVFSSLYKNINFKINSKFYIDYFLLLKHLLNRYLFFCKENNFTQIFGVQRIGNTFPYDILETFLKEYYSKRFEESRKISKFISNIEILENSASIYDF